MVTCLFSWESFIHINNNSNFWNSGKDTSCKLTSFANCPLLLKVYSTRKSTRAIYLYFIVELLCISILSVHCFKAYLFPILIGTENLVSENRRIPKLHITWVTASQVLRMKIEDLFGKSKIAFFRIPISSSIHFPYAYISFNTIYLILCHATKGIKDFESSHWSEKSWFNQNTSPMQASLL